MENNSHINADRFLGFADIYDSARPKCPEKVKDILLMYLAKKQSVVVDLGCGTGLFTAIWSDISDKVISIEPSNDMIKLAREKAYHIDNINFVSTFSDNTGLEGSCAIGKQKLNITNFLRRLRKLNPHIQILKIVLLNGTRKIIFIILKIV